MGLFAKAKNLLDNFNRDRDLQAAIKLLSLDPDIWALYQEAKADGVVIKFDPGLAGTGMGAEYAPLDKEVLLNPLVKQPDEVLAQRPTAKEMAYSLVHELHHYRHYKILGDTRALVKSGAASPIFYLIFNRTTEADAFAQEVYFRILLKRKEIDPDHIFILRRKQEILRGLFIDMLPTLANYDNRVVTTLERVFNKHIDFVQKYNPLSDYLLDPVRVQILPRSGRDDHQTYLPAMSAQEFQEMILRDVDPMIMSKVREMDIRAKSGLTAAPALPHPQKPLQSRFG